MNYGFRFRDWDIYKEAIIFRRELNVILREFPKEEKYALIDQTKRALNSIVLNIAEGANKSTDKDARLYMNRSLCSLDEVVACLDCALEDLYIDKDIHGEKLEQASMLARKLKGFAIYLSKDIASKTSD